MQRHAMLMYTSCGWFFDELSGIETVQVIQYAGRAVQLAEELFGRRHRTALPRKIGARQKQPPRARATARQSTPKFVKPASVDLLKLGAHYAMSSLFESYPDNTRIYSYSVDNKDYRLKRSGKMRLAFGKARFTSEITQETEMLMFGVLHFGDHNLHGGVAPNSLPRKHIANWRSPRAKPSAGRTCRPPFIAWTRDLPARPTRSRICSVTSNARF